MQASPQFDHHPLAGVLGLLALCLLLAGCFGPPEPPEEPDPPARPQGWHELGQEEAMALVQRLSPARQGLRSWTELEDTLRACRDWLERYPTGGRARDPRLSRAAMLAANDELLRLLPRLDSEPRLLAERFTWLAYAPDPVVTGYHLPLIPASLEPHPDYPHPIYGPPPDLKTLDLGQFHPRWQGQRLVYRLENGEAVPYYDREEIDFDKRLAGRGLEIAWAKSLVDVNHLQIQGSGELLLPDGSHRLCSYAAKNGQPFKGLGAIFLERNFLPGQHLTRSRMADYLDQRPHLWREVLAENESYVFFQLKDGPPTGAMGTPLQGRVSLAVDREVIPLGAPVLLLADLPRTVQEEALRTLPGVEQPARTLGLHLAQDTGGAIKGARIDHFWGKGSVAEELAMRTKTPARIFVPLQTTREQHKVIQ